MNPSQVFVQHSLVAVKRAKIDCGKAHFRALSDGNDAMRYIKASTVDNIFECAN
jgi:hypothetical protein